MLCNTHFHSRVPDNVLWFEPPSIARWDFGRQCWTKDYIYEIKFNEEKQVNFVLCLLHSKLNYQKSTFSGLSVLHSKLNSQKMN